MKEESNKITSKHSTERIFLLFSILIFIGSSLYFINNDQQQKEYLKLRYSETRLNDINAIYISMLTSTIEARGYRIYKELDLKNNYTLYKNKTLKLLKTYQQSKSQSNPAESIYIDTLKQRMYRRFTELDSSITKPIVIKDGKTDSIVAAKLGTSTLQIIKSTEDAFAMVISYWERESLESLNAYEQRNKSTDIIFLIWILLTLTISFVWIISSQKMFNYQRRLNNELIEQKNKIEASKHQLENFAYIVSHDLKAPLRSIKGLLNIIQKKGSTMQPDKKEHYFNVVTTAANDMSKLIDNLLEYSRTTNVQEERIELEVIDIANKQKHIFAAELTPLQGRLEFDSAVQKINVYPILFQRLLTNLISNAIKYRSIIPPIIELSCKEESENLFFAVKDNGIGIPENQFNDIFKIFKSLNPNEDSNGIGLSVCKEIVELHGGKIWLESAPGEGTTFYFTISKTI